MKFPIFFLLALLALPLTAQESVTWDEAPQFSVDLDNRPDPGIRLFQPSNHKPFLLLTSSAFKAVLVIDLQSRVVHEIAVKEVKADGEYAVATKGIPQGRMVAKYGVDGARASFGYLGKVYVVKAKEPIVGEATEAMIYQHSPLYAILRDKYKPKKAAVDFMKSYGTKTEVVVIFATWCPTCKRLLPHFLRLMKDANNPVFSMKFFGLAMGGAEPKWIVDTYGHDYPAFIFYQNGKEKARIFGDPPGLIEQTVVNLLKR